MRVAKLETLRPGDVLDNLRLGLRFRVSTLPRPDKYGNARCWAQSGALTVQLSTRDCGHYRIRRRSKHG
jgi:hypothetical protein